jgi:hypothetical protein
MHQTQYAICRFKIRDVSFPGLLFYPYMPRPTKSSLTNVHPGTLYKQNNTVLRIGGWEYPSWFHKSV